MLGDVVKHALHQQRLVTSRMQHYAFVSKPKHLAVRGKHAVFRFEQFPVFLKVFFGCVGDLAVFKVNMVHPVPRILEPFFGREAENRLDLRTHVMPRAAGSQLGNVGNRGQTFHERSIAIFGRAKLRMVAVALDGEGGKVRGVRDQLKMLRVGRARLAIVDGESSKQRAVWRSNGS